MIHNLGRKWINQVDLGQQCPGSWLLKMVSWDKQPKSENTLQNSHDEAINELKIAFFIHCSLRSFSWPDEALEGLAFCYKSDHLMFLSFNSDNLIERLDDQVGAGF